MDFHRKAFRFLSPGQARLSLAEKSRLKLLPPPPPSAFLPVSQEQAPAWAPWGKDRASGPGIFLQGGGGSSFRSSIQHSSNLGQTGSSYFFVPLFRRGRQASPHDWKGAGGGGEESPLESGQQAAADSDSCLFTQHQESHSV